MRVNEHSEDGLLDRVVNGPHQTSFLFSYFAKLCEHSHCQSPNFFTAAMICSGLEVSYPRSSNDGCHYFLYTVGGLMILLWTLRFSVRKS